MFIRTGLNHRLCPDCSRARLAARGSASLRHWLPELLWIQANLCGICWRPLPADTSLIHVDHITPAAHGGSDELDNLQATHQSCNLHKSASLDHEDRHNPQFRTLIVDFSGTRP